jgi:hypothetical protein
MIKPIKRSVSRASSVKILDKRIAYIVDPNVEEHKGLVIYEAKNYNCSGPDPEQFKAACLKADEEYHKSPERRKGGRASTRLFEELIYSTPPGAHLNALERTSIESTLVNTFSRHSACRFAWHANETTGRCDLHVLIASKNEGWPPALTLWAAFGGSKKPHIFATINRVSDAIIKDLNKTRKPSSKLKSAQTVHKERVASLKGKKHPSLAKELAKLGLAPDELAAGIRKLGYEITRENEKTISVKFHGKKKANKYNKAELLKDIADIPLEPLVKEWKPKKWKEKDIGIRGP